MAKNAARCPACAAADVVRGSARQAETPPCARGPVVLRAPARGPQQRLAPGRQPADQIGYLSSARCPDRWSSLPQHLVGHGANDADQPERCPDLRLAAGAAMAISRPPRRRPRSASCRARWSPRRSVPSRPDRLLRPPSSAGSRASIICVERRRVDPSLARSPTASSAYHRTLGAAACRRLSSSSASRHHWQRIIHAIGWVTTSAIRANARG